jgi:hypothetical protein
MDNRMFPEELLNGSVEDKWKFFWNYPLNHPNLNLIFNSVMTQIEMSLYNDSLILVYGPTRVGKSFLAEQIFQAINSKYKNEMEENKGIIPAIVVEAASPEKGHFDWQGFYISALEELEDILIDHKEVPDMPKVPKGFNRKAREHRKTSVLNLALISALKNRQTKVLIIDEAHHIAKRLKGEKLKDQMDVIKTLANKTKIPIVLLGTYELQIFKDQSGQLASRGMHNHFTRYKYNNERDRTNFVLCLYIFQQLLPLKKEPSLEEHYKFFYSRTLGCVGQLKLLFSRTLRGKLEENPNLETLVLSDFEKYALTIDQCDKVRGEIEQGENQEVIEISEETLFRRLGMIEDDENIESQTNDDNYVGTSVEETENSEKSGQAKKNENKSKENNTKTKKGKPFQRNPMRDSIEMPEEFEGMKKVVD